MSIPTLSIVDDRVIATLSVQDNAAAVATSAAATATEQAGIATEQAGISTTKAGEAATSASNAATSATNAATSETNAAASEAAAAISETNAAASAVTASTYANLNVSYIQNFFVRPSGTNYGLGNGASYENAWSGFSNIDWSLITPNTKLYICGTHNETLTIGSNLFNLRGDFFLEAGIIDGQNTRTTCITVNNINFSINAITVRNSTTSNLNLTGTSTVFTYDLVTHGSGNQNIQHLDTAKSYNYRLDTYGAVDDGVSLHDACYCEIYDSHIHDNGEGVNNIATSTVKVYRTCFENNSSWDAFCATGTSPNSVKMELHNCYLSGKAGVFSNAELKAYNSYIGVIAQGSSAAQKSIILERCFVASLFFDVSSGNTFSAKYCILKSTVASGFTLLFRAGSIPTLNNCVLVGNSSNNGLFIVVNFTGNNNIITGFVTAVQRTNGTAVLNNTCFHNNTTNTTGTITNNNPVNADPLFVDAANNDFTLQLSSPCISAGILTDDDLGIKTSDWNNLTIPVMREKSNGKPFDIGAYVK
jgi:hypothetical protein